MELDLSQTLPLRHSREYKSIKRTPIRAALEQLSAAELKRIGVSIKDDDDQVVIRDTANEIDKIVSALLAQDKSLDE